MNLRKILILGLLYSICFFGFSHSSQMILVDAGNFQMGWKQGCKDAQIVHTVYVDRFYIDKYKITLSDWTEIMESIPCDYKAWGGVAESIANFTMKPDSCNGHKLV